ncbi:MAG: hypothetical protein ABWZ25_16120 [Chitinophagaceae bacterium]
MKKSIFALLIACIAFAGTSSAQSYKTALGVRLSPANGYINNAITFKHFLDDSKAIEALVSFGDPFSLGALYEVHKPFASEGLQWFYGAGGYLAFVKSYNPNTEKNETDANFGAQGIIGLDYKFANLPLNLSLDWKPELNLFDDITFEASTIGLSARFTF